MCPISKSSKIRPEKYIYGQTAEIGKNIGSIKQVILIQFNYYEINSFRFPVVKFNVFFFVFFFCMVTHRFFFFFFFFFKKKLKRQNVSKTANLGYPTIISLPGNIAVH